MSKSKGYKDLKIWNRGIDLVSQVYIIINEFPKEEQFGLISQMRRCSISVPSNIAEGWGRNTNKYFIQFCNHSRGSLMELETQSIIARKLNYINKKDFEILDREIEELIKMLNRFITKLKN